MSQQEFNQILFNWLKSYDKKRNCYGEIERFWANQHEIDIINLANAIRNHINSIDTKDDDHRPDYEPTSDFVDYGEEMDVGYGN